MFNKKHSRYNCNNGGNDSLWYLVTAHVYLVSCIKQDILDSEYHIGYKVV